MIEASTLPYVDLSNSADALRAFALENFGKKINQNAKDETVRERFAQIYKEETGVALPPYDPAAETQSDDDGLGEGEDNEDGGDFTTTPTSAVASKKKTPRFAIISLQEDQNDPHDVKLGLNFRAYLIQRNVETKIPYALLGVLRDAKRTVFNPKTMIAKEVPAYPFSILGYED